MLSQFPKTYFSTPLSGSARATRARIRNIFQGQKKRPPIWLMALVVLSVLLCGSLVSCQEGSGLAPGPSSQEDLPLPAIVMESQYYDRHQTYVEIPRLVMPEVGQPDQAVAAINRELDQIREEYQYIFEGLAPYYNPFREIADIQYCLFYPSTTSRYLNLLLLQQGINHDGDGDVRSWVYDRQEARLVTEDDALNLAGATREALFGGLDQALQNDPEEVHTVLRDCQIQGFRIREDGSVVFYVKAYTDYQETEGAERCQWTDRLYVCQEGTCTRYDCLFTMTDLQPLVPAGETDRLSPALWCQWYFEGEPPEEAASPAPPENFSSLDPETRNAFANVLTSLVEGQLGPNGDWPVQLSSDPEYNKFAVTDIDGDGKSELILLYSTAIYAGYSGVVLAYDEDTGAVRTELREFPKLIFYDTGVALAGWSHNQGWGNRFWPYDLYQYDAKSDAYVHAASVDGWDRWVSDHNEGFTPFPTELDVSGTGILYYINAEGFDSSTLTDAQTYYRWLNTYLGGGHEIVPAYLSLTQENIRLLRQGDLAQPLG